MTEISVEQARRERDAKAARDKAKAKGSIRFVSMEEIVEQADAPEDWLVNGLLPSAGLAVLYGRWKSFKSFVALDLGLAIASGQLWAARECKPGAVVYICGEGAQGMRKRIRAYAVHRDLHGLPFYVVERALNFGGEGPQDVQPFIKAAREQLGQTQPVLVIVDTLSRMLFAGDENNDGMRAFTDACEAISAEFQCLVLAVHHEGANTDAKRPRGSTVLPGAVVATWKVTKSTNGSAYACDVAIEDAKDSESGIELHVVLDRVQLTDDAEGDTTLIVDTIEPREPGATKKPAEKGERRPPPTMRALLAAFEQALHDKGEQLVPFRDGPAVRAVDLEDVRPVYYRMRADDLTEGSRRTVFARHVRNATDRQDLITRQFGPRVMVWHGGKP